MAEGTSLNKINAQPDSCENFFKTTFTHTPADSISSSQDVHILNLAEWLEYRSEVSLCISLGNHTNKQFVGANCRGLIISFAVAHLPGPPPMPPPPIPPMPPMPPSVEPTSPPAYLTCKGRAICNELAPNIVKIFLTPGNVILLESPNMHASDSSFAEKVTKAHPVSSFSLAYYYHTIPLCALVA